MPLGSLLTLHSVATSLLFHSTFWWSTSRLPWQCTDRTCFTLDCPLSPVLSCSPPQLLSLHNDDTLSLHLGLTHFAAVLLVAETPSMCLLLWINSQTSAKLLSFPNWLKAESKYVFKQRASSPNEIAPALLYQTHRDLRNTDSNFCYTEKFLLPRNPPNINSSNNSETYLKLPFKKISALGLGAAVRASLLKLQNGFF